MSDQTAGGMPQHGHRVPKAEFFVYFALIFVLALPVQALALRFVDRRTGEEADRRRGGKLADFRHPGGGRDLRRLLSQPRLSTS